MTQVASTDISTAFILSDMFAELEAFTAHPADKLHVTLTEALALYAGRNPSQAAEAVRCLGNISNLLRIIYANGDYIHQQWQYWHALAEELDKVPAA